MREGQLCTGPRVTALSGDHAAAEGGAEINAKDNSGQTALHFAARDGCEGVVQLLLNYEIDIDAKDHMGKTALYEAAENGYLVVVRLLKKGSDIKADPEGEQKALERMAGDGQEAVVRLLLKKRVDVNSKCVWHQTGRRRCSGRLREEMKRWCGCY
jgi:hypothetical protein